VRAKLAERGIIVQARSRTTLAEEQPEVYKDVEEVVKVAAGAGLARPVARLRPLGGIKG
jgi:tRNA-splicing ligase RtcB (3'-phosphate/5'-hydroxy nucleic acid ligase)